ncbi:hypothetical protein DFQ26_000225 [Actinomortierella ambigua]|nr:hypothetical protein DFQ26_000225 [Actinomortierella ambigua]
MSGIGKPRSSSFLRGREKHSDLGYKIPADKNVAVEVVTNVAKFLTAFENFYSEAMTPDLLNEMVWRCMRLSLIEAELDEEYKKRIEASQDRSFQKVKTIVMDLTRLDNLMAVLNKLVLSIEVF